MSPSTDGSQARKSGVPAPSLFDIFGGRCANGFRRLAQWRKAGALGEELKARRRSMMRFEPLEPRLLLSADLNVVIDGFLATRNTAEQQPAVIAFDYVADDGVITIGNSVGGDGADIALEGVTLTFSNLSYDTVNGRWNGQVGVEATSASLFPDFLDVEVNDDADADAFAVAGVINLVDDANDQTVDTLHLDDIDAEAIGWPKFLDINFTELELTFPEFRVDNDRNSLHLEVALTGLDTGNAALNELLAADNPLFGLSIQGSASVDLAIAAIEDTVDAVNNPDVPAALKGALAAAMGSGLDGLTGLISGKLFGLGSIEAGFIYQKVTVDPDGAGPLAEETATYLAIEGGFSFVDLQDEGGLSGGGRDLRFDIAFAFSDLGPLQFFLSGGPIKRFEPTTGLTIEEAHLGVRFNTTIEDLQTETDFTTTVAQVEAVGSVFRVTLTIPDHDLAIGNDFRIRNADNSNYDGEFKVFAVNGDQVSYEVANDPGLFIGDAEIIRLTITDPFDLRDAGLESGIAPPDSIFVWRDQLDAAVENQIQAGDDIWARLFGEVVFGGGATLSIDPIPDTVMQLKVDLMIDTDLRILFGGNLSFLDGLVEFPASLYADLSDLFSGSGRFLFLADLPKVPVVDPLLVLRGEVSFEPLSGTDLLDALVSEDGGFWEIDLVLALDNPSDEYSLGDIDNDDDNDNAVIFGSGLDGTYKVIGINDATNTITLRSNTNPGTWDPLRPGAVVNENALGGGFRIAMEGGVDLNIPLVTTVTLEGEVELEFKVPAAAVEEDLLIDLAFDVTLSETNVGNIGNANGKFHVSVDADVPPSLEHPVGGVDIWGAALLTTDFEFLESVGLFAGASGLLRINSSGSDKPAEVLSNVNGDPVVVALPAQSFALRLDGSVDFRIDFNGDQDYTLSESAFLAEGIFVLEFSAEQGFNVALFNEGSGGTITAATLELGPAGNRLLEFDVFGFLAIRDDGFAANMVLSTDRSLPLDLASIEATAVLVVNTTGRDVSFTIPGGAADPNRPTGLSLTIPRAGPTNPSAVLQTLNLQQFINGQGWSVAPATPGSPYGVVFLTGSLELLSVLAVDVSGFVLLSADVVSLEANFSASGNFLNLASASASGTLFFSSEGEFEVDVHGNVQLGPDGFNISGSADLEISFLDNNGRASGGDRDFDLAVDGSLRVSGEIFFIPLPTATVDVGYNSNSGDISVSVGPVPIPGWDSDCWDTAIGEICVYWPTIEFRNLDFTVGNLKATAVPPPPPVLGQLDGNGVLTLNVGASAGARNLMVGEINETVIIDRVGNAIQISMFGHSQTFSGVTAILIADMGSGSDFVDVRASVATPLEVHFGTGNDRLRYLGSGAVTAFGDDDDDRLEAGSADDHLFGGAGDDLIDGGAGHDWIEGGTEGDTLFGGDGNDTILGGRDSDLIAGDRAVVEGDANAAIVRTIASAGGNDVIRGGDGVDIVFGGGGSDSIAGDAGADHLFGEDGTVTIPANQEPIVARANLGSSGNDTFDWSVGDANDTIDGQLGSDTLNILGTDGSPEQVTVSAKGAGFTAAIGSSTLSVDGVEVSNIEGRRGGDTFTINDLTASVLQQINLKLGDDVVHDAVVVNGSSSGEVFTVTPIANTLRIQNTGGVTVDIFDASTISGGDTITLNSAGGADIVNILGTRDGTSTTVNTGAGADTINVGSLAPATGGTVDVINAPLSVNGGDDFDTLNVDDLGDTSPNTGTLTATTVSGLGMAVGIGYGAFESLNILLGTGSDTFTIMSTHLGATVLETSAGNDTVHVLSTAGETTVNSGAEHDTVNVRTIGAATTVNTGSGDDTINVGSLSGAVDGIAALLTVNGNDPASGSDVLNVDDSGDTGPNTGTLTATTIAGLDMVGSITYGTIETLNIDLGSGGDTFTIAGTHAGTTTLNSNAGGDTVNVQTISGAMTVNTGGEDDTINVGGLAPAMGGNVNAISAPLAISGGGGSDTLNVDDTGDADPNSGVLTAMTLAGLGMAGGITYTDFEALEISLGSGGNHFDITGTMRRDDGGTATVVNTGAGNDVVTVSVDAATDGPLTVNLQGGDDTLDASDSSLDLVISGGEGNDAIAGGSGADTIFGDQGADVIHGNGGDDTLYGGGGDDEMYGELGDDSLYGEGGNDVLLGDTGQIVLGNVLLTDVAHVTGELPLNVPGLPAVSEATVNALRDADLVLLVGRSNADGSMDSRALLVELVADGDDALSGGDGDDALFGQRGNDILNGDAGSDLLSGGAGDDEAYGGTGDDTIVGDELYVDSTTGVAPNVSHGLLINGTVVVPTVQTIPGATLNAVASVLPYVFGYGANSLLPAADGGVAFLVYASVVTDFGHHLAQVRGNDILGGGDGNDTLVGDDQMVLARSLSFDNASMARAEVLTRGLLDVADDFSDLVHRQFDLLDTHDHDYHHDDGILVVDQVFKIGADELDGGDGNDVLIGDDNQLIEPSFMLPVGLAGDFERFVEGITDAGDELAHGVLDLGELDHHLREVVVLVPHENHFHERVEHHVDIVALGNDMIAGGNGDDLIVGDAFIVRTPGVTLVAGGSTSNYGADDAWQDDDWKDKYGLDDWAWKHHDHDGDDEWSAASGIKVGADTLSGGAGADLIWGDNLALVTTAVKRGVGLGSGDFDNARGATEDGLEGLAQLADSATYWLPLQGGEHHHHHHDHWYHDAGNYRFDNGDDISGGDGDDIAFGQDGDDTLSGDAGNDWLVGGEGKDELDGGTGWDKLKYDSDESNGLQSAVASRMINWNDSFKNYGLPIAPFGGLTLGKGHGGSNFANFDFLSHD